MLGPRLIAAHAVHVTPEEIGMLAHQGASIAHCPSSNLKLASGFRARGGNARARRQRRHRHRRRGEQQPPGLVPGNAHRRASRKGGERRRPAMPAHQALAAATLHGARALGLDAAIGSLAPGKFADLCAVAFEEPELAPRYDPVSASGVCAGREHVSHVWVAGKPRVRERTLVVSKIAA